MTIDGERKRTIKSDNFKVLKSKDVGQSTGFCNTLFDTLIQNVSDKLRSPLFVIKSYSQLLQRTQEQGRLDRGLLLMEEASIRMETTISELIKLVHIYTNGSSENELKYFRESYDRAFVSLYDVRDIVTAEYDVDFSEETKIWFNSDFLEVLFKELISNALLHNSGVEELSIKVSSYKLMERIVLEVKDNGLGFDIKGLKEEIKEPFNSQTKLPQCVGVGLSKVEAIAKVTGSVFEIESKPGQGTTCRFYFG